MKICTVCKQNKNLSDYHNSSIHKDGKNYRCKLCDKEARERYAKNNPEAYKNTIRFKSIKHVYGLDKQQYLDLVESQENKCKICGLEKDRMVIDHCHATGHVRAILCNSCNRGLGYFGDNPCIMRKAAEYVETH